MHRQPESARDRRWLLGIVFAYLTLAVLTAATSLPVCDEAWFAIPGYNLAQGHGFGTSVLEPSSVRDLPPLTGLDRVTYWIPPLHPLAMAAWCRIAGRGLLAARLLSVLWGLAALTGWSLIVRWRNGPGPAGGTRPLAALFLAALLALDFEFLRCAAQARMDMMTEALLAWAVASYLLLRGKSLARALLVSQTLVVLAGLTHPIALGGFVGLTFLILYLDRRRLRPRDVLPATLPYLAAALAWGGFVARAPDLFRDQFLGNFAGHWGGTGNGWRVLWDQIDRRFLNVYGLIPGVPGWAHLKAVVLLAYAGALFAGWMNRGFRRSPERRPLLIFCSLLPLAYAALDPGGHEFYLVHLLTPLAAVLAMILDWTLRGAATRRPALGRAVTMVLVILGAVQLATTAARVRRDGYHREFLPAARFVAQQAQPQDLIMGSAELGFALGWGANLVDDYRLGARTGRVPAIVVLDANRYVPGLERLRSFDPDAWRHATGLLEDQFEPAYRNGAYTVYLRRAAAGGQSSSSIRMTPSASR